MRRVIYHELVANCTGASLFPCSSRSTSFLSAFSVASACCAGWPAPAPRALSGNKSAFTISHRHSRRRRRRHRLHRRVVLALVQSARNWAACRILRRKLVVSIVIPNIRLVQNFQTLKSSISLT